jgi:hypothetical protein
MGMTEGERRRRRIRTSRGGDTAPADATPTPRPPSCEDNGRMRSPHTATTADVYDDGTPHIPNLSISTLAGTSGEDRDERSLRGLIGGGSSQVSVQAAMRARDASRPTGEDIAATETELTIVHRGWMPRDG